MRLLANVPAVVDFNDPDTSTPKKSSSSAHCSLEEAKETVIDSPNNTNNQGDVNNEMGGGLAKKVTDDNGDGDDAAVAAECTPESTRRSPLSTVRFCWFAAVPWQFVGVTSAQFSFRTHARTFSYPPSL